MKTVLLADVIIVAVIFTGWVMNIIQLAHSSFDPLTGIVVIKCIGVFIPPLGAIMGFIG